MKRLAIREILSKAQRQHKKVFFLTSLTTLALLLYLFAVVFGIDQLLIVTPINGKVTNQQGVPISDVVVKLQGKETVTDENGKYMFDDINFGTYEFILEKNGYVRHSERVKIKRFSNITDFSLRTLEYGELRLIFEGSDKELVDFNVKINNEPFSIKQDDDMFILDTGRLLTGNYLLEVSSQSYKDFEDKIDLKSGNSEQTYQLEPAGDVVAEFRDYLSGNIISPSEINILLDDKLYESVNSDIPGKIELKDIEIKKEYKVIANLDGYIQKEVSFTPNQGLNSLGAIEMFKDERILLSEDDKIISMFLDGSGKQNLYNVKTSCRVAEIKNQYTLYGCGSIYLLFERVDKDYKLIRDYVVTGGFSTLNIQNLQLVVISSDLKSIEQIHSSINSSTLYTHDKEIDTVVVDFSGTIYFSDTSAVYSYKDSHLEKLIEGNFSLETISPDNSIIVALGSRSSSGNIWGINTKSKQANRITFLPNLYREVKFSDNETIYYLVSDELITGSINSNNFRKVAEDIDYYWLDSHYDFIPVLKEKDTYFVSKENDNIKPVAN